MADNSTLPATGDVIATEDIASVKYQKVKIYNATAGSVAPLTTFPVSGTVALSGTSAVSAASLPLPALAATSTIQATQQTTLDGILAGVTDTTPVGVYGVNASVAATTLTRPANAIPYSVGDVITTSTVTGTVGEFATASRLASSMSYLVGLQCITSQSTCVAQLRVHFWSAAPTGASVPVDNAAFALLVANKSTYLGWVDLPVFTMEDATSTIAVAFSDQLWKRLVTDSSSKVYWQLQTKTAASGQTFDLVATFEKN